MTIRAFVIGQPINHSRSPLIHGTWLAQYGIDGSYDAIAVAPDALPTHVNRLRSGEFAGGNVTIPHKLAVLGLCDDLDPLAARIGAVNTLVMRQGRLHGSNTDYQGFLGNLDQQSPGWSDGLDQAIVLGAGGAARAVLVALAHRGIERIHILNRTADTAKALAAEMGPAFHGAGLEQFASLAPHSRLLVNTSAVGMHHTRFEGLDLALLPKDALVTDIVYTPLITPLLADAQALGLNTVDGLGMLLHQAVPGFEAWFGVRPEVTDELRAKIVATL